MGNPSEVQQVSMTNTKKELLDAYQAAKRILKAQEKDLLDAEKARNKNVKRISSAVLRSSSCVMPHSLFVFLRNTECDPRKTSHYPPGMSRRFNRKTSWISRLTRIKRCRAWSNTT